MVINNTTTVYPRSFSNKKKYFKFSHILKTYYILNVDALFFVINYSHNFSQYKFNKHNFFFCNLPLLHIKYIKMYIWNKYFYKTCIFSITEGAFE